MQRGGLATHPRGALRVTRLQNVSMMHLRQNSRTGRSEKTWVTETGIGRRTSMSCRNPSVLQSSWKTSSMTTGRNVPGCSMRRPRRGLHLQQSRESSNTSRNETEQIWQSDDLSVCHPAPIFHWHSDRAETHTEIACRADQDKSGHLGHPWHNNVLQTHLCGQGEVGFSPCPCSWHNDDPWHNLCLPGEGESHLEGFPLWGLCLRDHGKCGLCEALPGIQVYHHWETSPGQGKVPLGNWCQCRIWSWKRRIHSLHRSWNLLQHPLLVVYEKV